MGVPSSIRRRSAAALPGIDRQDGVSGHVGSVARRGLGPQGRPRSRDRRWTEARPAILGGLANYSVAPSGPQESRPRRILTGLLRREIASHGERWLRAADACGDREDPIPVRDPACCRSRRSRVGLADPQGRWVAPELLWGKHPALGAAPEGA